MLRNITLSADKDLIDRARLLAETENSTLNAEFRIWLNFFVHSKQGEFDLQNTMDKLEYVIPGKTFNGDEMNER